jgi:hypothetical protein
MKEYCVCKHSKDQHTETNGKHWARLQNQLVGYKEHSLADREKFWAKFLTEGSDDEWRCENEKCKCDSFKLDNLKLIEDIAKERKLI